MDSSERQLYQNVVVMRHGDRIDNFEPQWAAAAARPWDPPLVEAGKVRAFCTGRKLRGQLGFRIHRVFVSPFLRCVQTAAEVVSALCAVDHDGVDPNHLTSQGVSIDPSKIKVSIEYGLCEMLNREAIRPNVAPKDGKFSFNISELAAMLPAGTVDHSAQKVYSELPRWEETVTGARARYMQIINALADKFPSENLLLVTHGEGVGVAFSTFMKDVTVYEVEYCAYSHLRRSISVGDKNSFTAGDFENLIPKGQIGIRYYPLSTTEDDPLV
ncbi:Ubiquitin-associated and SH3 domain-containing protein [Actinidia chinensis var. chinensis]|uniref:Ubiquitin-associated and SH3 domain-containing protein n=1 Tax=Actinidia chinensis var. chinensis TaxID=1590841 RepID=A0A2R6S0Z0_ACTCC|nr:Ubiquitin-associated and SH3 domain-containing protein [Actinidia chinensis var. chinensis]